jgi:hypothetical protein
VDLADFEGEGVGDLFFILFYQFVDDLGDYLVISLDLQQLQQIEILRRGLD